jgi:hypothetical protein
MHSALYSASYSASYDQIGDQLVLTAHVYTGRLVQISAAIMANMRVCTTRALHTANVLLDRYLPMEVVVKVI